MDKVHFGTGAGNRNAGRGEKEIDGAVGYVEVIERKVTASQIQINYMLRYFRARE